MKPRRSAALGPRKAPRQQRSQATVATILEAAARVLAAESLAGFNTNRVAEVAGVSVGSLYQYFPNKTALVAALAQRAQSDLAEALTLTVLAVEGLSLEDSLRAVIALAIEQQYREPLLAAAIDHEERRLPALQDAASDQRLLQALAPLIERHRRRLSQQLPPAALADCLVITKAMVEADVARSVVPPPGLETRVLRALLGCLTL